MNTFGGVMGGTPHTTTDRLPHQQRQFCTASEFGSRGAGAIRGNLCRRKPLTNGGPCAMRKRDPEQP